MPGDRLVDDEDLPVSIESDHDRVRCRRYRQRDRELLSRRLGLITGKGHGDLSEASPTLGPGRAASTAPPPGMPCPGRPAPATATRAQAIAAGPVREVGPDRGPPS